MARLAARNTSNLNFKVHSDPKHNLLLKLKETPQNEAPVFVKETMKCEKFDSGTSVPYKDYNMVQPALVVVHKSGKIQQVLPHSERIHVTILVLAWHNMYIHNIP